MQPNVEMTYVKSGGDLPAPQGVPAESVIALLTRHPQFHGVPDAVLARALTGSERRRLAVGEYLVRERDPARYWFLIERGSIDMLRFDEHGDERVFHQFGVGDLVADMVMFMPHGLYPMNARAGVDTVVHRFTRNALWHLCESHSPLAMRMLQRLGERLFQRVNELEWLASSNGTQRIAAYLLEQRRSQRSDTVKLPISQRQLAATLGIRAETLSRTLAEWSAAGRLRGERRTWTLCDLKWLEASVGRDRLPVRTTGDPG